MQKSMVKAKMSERKVRKRNGKASATVEQLTADWKCVPRFIVANLKV
jgi:hypothetical protein